MKAPNFLHIPLKKMKGAHMGVVIFFAVLLTSLYMFTPGYLVLLLMAAFVVFVAAKPYVGAITLAFFSFFHSWEIVFSSYAWARNYPILPTINAPVVDLVSVLLLISLVLAVAFKTINKKDISRLLHHSSFFIAYGLFIVWAGISALNSFDQNISMSLKFWARPMIFVSIAYAVLPVLYIKKRSELIRIFKILFWIGLGIALFGLSSLFLAPQGSWLRVVPYGIKGFAPLGYNHNLLAEVLVAIIPIGWYLWHRSKDIFEKKWYMRSIVFMIIIALMTLSRAAWLAILVQCILLLFFYKEEFKKIISKHTRLVYVFSSIVFVIIAYMGLFLFSNIVQSSNTARIETSRIAIEYANRSPFLGEGPGMFTTVLGQTRLYTLDFGEPLDAHGFVQKLMLETGYVGLLLFVIALSIFLYSLLRSSRYSRMGQAMVVMVVSIIIFQLFNTSYFNSVMWFPIGLAAVSMSLHKHILHE